VQRLVKERCDVRVRLPVAGRVASLNASAAAAALLYEVMRQRARKSPT
jgi:23S rRNA (guanosine2251-2'-O)-methyltransferase